MILNELYKERVSLVKDPNPKVVALVITPKGRSYQHVSLHPQRGGVRMPPHRGLEKLSLI